MEYKSLVDTHTHTDNSFDGVHSPIHLCERGVELNLRAIAFTDHCEVDTFIKGNYARTILQSYFEVAKAQSAFMGLLLVLQGVELGQPHYDTKLAKRILEKYDYDFILGSVHNLRGQEDFYFMDYEKIDLHTLLDEYFEEIYKLVQWNEFDSLAHLTYPLRYIVGEHGLKVDMSRYDDVINESLSLLAKNGKALEINTSGLRQKIGVTMPTAEYVKRFKNFGGELVTIGSDAHSAENLAYGLVAGMDIAKEAGFNSTALFQKREPILLPIKKMKREESADND